MLTVEGPAVFMSQAYYRFKGGMTSAVLGICLQGMSTLPVTANLSVAQRRLGGSPDTEAAPSLELALNQTQLMWRAGEAGRQNVSLAIGGDTGQLSEVGILVSVVSSENADVDPQNSTSIVTALNPAQLTVGFALEPNQVGYSSVSAACSVPAKNQ